MTPERTLEVHGVLFDMDGTLVDSTAMVEHIWTEFAQANATDPRAVIDFAHGRPSRDTVARFAANSARIDKWLHWIHTAEAERFGTVVAIPGAREVVCALPPERWAVVTSAIHGPAQARLVQNGFPTPAVLVGADDVRHGKPHPEGYLAAALALGLDPARCVVFEDTSAGIEAGRAAGCAVVAVGDVRVHGIAVRIRDFTDVRVARTTDGVALTFP